jgi:hypothetical protein
MLTSFNAHAITCIVEIDVLIVQSLQSSVKKVAEIILNLNYDLVFLNFPKNFQPLMVECLSLPQGEGYIIFREELETIEPEWPSEAGLYPTFEERVGYVIRQAAGIAYISRLARRLTSVEEAPEPFRSEAIKLGRTLEREWLRRKH